MYSQRLAFWLVFSIVLSFVSSPNIAVAGPYVSCVDGNPYHSSAVTQQGEDCILASDINAKLAFFENSNLASEAHEWLIDQLVALGHYEDNRDVGGIVESSWIFEYFYYDLMILNQELLSIYAPGRSFSIEIGGVSPEDPELDTLWWRKGGCEWLKKRIKKGGQAMLFIRNPDSGAHATSIVNITCKPGRIEVRDGNQPNVTFTFTVTEGGKIQATGSTLASGADSALVDYYHGSTVIGGYAITPTSSP